MTRQQTREMIEEVARSAWSIAVTARDAGATSPWAEAFNFDMSECQHIVRTTDTDALMVERLKVKLEEIKAREAESAGIFAADGHASAARIVAAAMSKSKRADV